MIIPFSNKLKFILLSGFAFLSLQMFAMDGDLDPAFNGIGTVITPIPGFNSVDINGVYIQADGKIVGVGNNTPFGLSSGTSFIAARYLTGGTLDPLFGIGGIATISLAPLLATGVEAKGVAVQSDGKIVVVGTVVISGATNNIYVARLTSTGILDATFNAAGMLPGVFVFPAFIGANENDQGTAVVVDIDGNIVVVGRASGGLRMAVGRLDSNGIPDNTFNGSGQQTVLIGTQSAAFAVALEADGRTIIAAGSAEPSTGPATGAANFAYARLLPTGAIDFTRIALFSTDADTLEQVTTEAHSVLIQPDGKVVLIGFTDWLGGDNFFALARYDSTGTLDPAFVGTPTPVNTFPNPGTFVAPSTDTINDPGENTVALAGGLQSDGKIVAGGSGPFTVDFPGARFIVGRFNGVDGTLDASFVGDGAAPVAGFVYTVFPPDLADEINAMALQGNGYIVAAGSSVTSVNPAPFQKDFALARYIVNTPLQLTTITSPTNGQLFTSGPISFAGNAQNPSIVDFFLDGTQIQANSTVTIGTGNSWSIPNVVVGPGAHTVRVVGRYRDDGHLNLQAEVTFVICDIVAEDATINTCRNTPIVGNLNDNVTGGTPPFTFAQVGVAINGTVSINAITGAYTFTPANDFVGIGSFQFQVTDDNGCVSNVATITVAIPCCPPSDPFLALIEELYWHLPPLFPI